MERYLKPVAGSAKPDNNNNEEPPASAPDPTKPAAPSFEEKFLVGRPCAGAAHDSIPNPAGAGQGDADCGGSAPDAQAEARGGSFAGRLDLERVPGSGRAESCLWCCGPFLVGMAPWSEGVRVWRGADKDLSEAAGGPERQLEQVFTVRGLPDHGTAAGEGPGGIPVLVAPLKRSLHGAAEQPKLGVWRLQDGLRLPDVLLPLEASTAEAAVLAVGCGGHVLCSAGGRLWVLRLSAAAAADQQHSVVLSAPLSSMSAACLVDPKKLPGPCWDGQNCGSCVKCVCVRLGEDIRNLTQKASYIRRLQVKHADATGRLRITKAAVAALKCGALWRDARSGRLMAAAGGSGGLGFAAVDVDGSVVSKRLLYAAGACAATNALELWPGKGTEGSARLVAGTQGHLVVQLDVSCGAGDGGGVAVRKVAQIDLSGVRGLKAFPVYSLALAPDGRHWVAASAWSRHVQFLDLDAGRRVHSERVMPDGCRDPERANVWQVASGASALFVSGTDDSLGPSEILACVPKPMSSRKPGARKRDAASLKNTIHDPEFQRKAKALMEYLRRPI